MSIKKILIVEDESLVGHHLKLILSGSGYKVTGIAESVAEALDAIAAQQPDLVLLDIHLKGPLNGIDLARQLTARNMAFVYLTANFQGTLLEEAKSTMPFGFIVKPFREDDLLTTLEVAFYRHQNSLESRRQLERDLSGKLRDIQGSSVELREKMLQIADILQAHIPFDYFNIVMRTATAQVINTLGFLRIGFDEYQVLGEREFLNVTGSAPDKLQQIYGASLSVTKARYFNTEDLDLLCNQNPLSKLIADTYDFGSALLLPALPEGTVLRYEFYNRRDDTYNQQHIALLSRLLNDLNNTITGEAVRVSSGERSLPLPKDKPGGSAAKDKSPDFDGIVAQSPPMLTVLDLIATIAPVDTSVLILGESGTGKERVAKSIHRLSARSNRPLVVVDCASLPANLIESELFGHEKGAYTGALDKRIGKFEMADKGTIFLDEIGELPIDLQVKLLRVLQEHEIERLGGKGPIKIDVRIIAATNRNLEKEMEEGRFRLDLYYRLFVFPILLPPLRERIDDIPALVDNFIAVYAKKYRKVVNGVSAGVLRQMLEYPWPGNVRELEHFIERSVLLSNGSIIEEVNLPRSSFAAEGNEPLNNGRIKTIEENERDYILSVLKKCNGRIRGSGGAAEIMGLPPTTLHSKMKKLGIR